MGEDFENPNLEEQEPLKKSQTPIKEEQKPFVDIVGDDPPNDEPQDSDDNE